MKRIDLRILGGGLLLLMGGVLLLQNIGLFQMGSLFWGVILFIIGILFFSVYINNRQHWWSLIPGYVFMGICGLLVLEQLFPPIANTWGGSIVLAAIATSFVHVFFTDRQKWWAIIPAGVLFTLASIAGLEDILTDIYVGGFLFIGMGLTFAILPLLSIPQQEPLKWAWIPAGILFVIGVLITGLQAGLINYVFPILLICLGLYFLFRTFIKGKQV